MTDKIFTEFLGSNMQATASMGRGHSVLKFMLGRLVVQTDVGPGLLPDGLGFL